MAKKKTTKKTALQLSADKLAGRIRREHELALASIRKGIVHARKCGNLLVRARAVVPAGDWIAWVEKNCGFGYESAKKYIRLATHWMTIETQMAEHGEQITDASINHALTYARQPKPATKTTASNKPADLPPQQQASRYMQFAKYDVTSYSEGELAVDEEGNVVRVTAPTAQQPPEPEPEGLTEEQRQVVRDYVVKALVSAGLVTQIDEAVMDKARIFLETLALKEEELYEHITMLAGH